MITEQKGNGRISCGDIIKHLPTCMAANEGKSQYMRWATPFYIRNKLITLHLL